MKNEVIEELCFLMLNSDGDKGEDGFDIKLRCKGLFDSEQLSQINKLLIKYELESVESKSIEKTFMELFYDFLYCCQVSINYNYYGKNTEYQINVNNSIESTVDIVKRIIKNSTSSSIAIKINELLLKENSGDFDGYLVKLKDGRGVDQQRMKQLCEALDEYIVAFKDEDIVEKYFMYTFINFMCDSYSFMYQYDEDEQMIIEDFADEISNKIWELVGR